MSHVNAAGYIRPSRVELRLAGTTEVVVQEPFALATITTTGTTTLTAEHYNILVNKDTHVNNIIVLPTLTGTGEDSVIGRVFYVAKNYVGQTLDLTSRTNDKIMVRGVAVDAVVFTTTEYVSFTLAAGLDAAGVAYWYVLDHNSTLSTVA